MQRRTTIRIAPDPFFRREGNDIHTDLDVPAPLAVLGGKATARTLKGTAEVTIPQIREAKAENRKLVMMTAYHTVPNAVQAIRWSEMG